MKSCAKAFIAGKGGVGSAAFSKSDKVGCDDAKVGSQLTCTNAFRNVIGSPTGFGAPGGTQSQEKFVYNADGLQLGAIALVGTCIPIGDEAQC